METKNTLETVAEEFAAAFTTDARDDGSTYVTRKDGCAPWVTSELCREIHSVLDDRLPNDWIYEKISEIADNLLEYDYTTADNMRESLHEIVDGAVDIYNADLLRWLASHSLNADLCDEAAREFGGEGDTIARIQRGQYYAIDQIAHAVIQAIEEEADSRPDPDDEA